MNYTNASSWCRKEFDEAVDAIEIDRRKNLKVTVANILERELADIPADVAEEYLPSRLQKLAKQCKDPLECGRYDRIDELLEEFARDLSRAMSWERREGSLRPLTVLSECKRVAGRLGACLWNGFSIAQLVSVLTPADLPILSISLREIKTTSRRIQRGFEEQTRPVSNSPEHWRSLATPENEIREKEAADERERAQAARPFSDYSGPNTKPGAN